MTTRDTPFAPGTPCWVDLASSDIEKTNAFYTSLFGWTAETSGEEYGGYVVYSRDGKTVAGAMPKQPGMDFPDAWTTYIATADCDATVDAVKSAGGSVMMGTMEVPDTGTMAIVQDPAGAAFGLWQAGNHTGFGRYNEPGSVTWDEYNSKTTDDYKTTSAFYSSVFNWEIESAGDSDEFRYAMGKIDGQPVVGLSDSSRFLPPDVPSHWAVYFSVENADAAAARVAELGGTMLQAPMDTPYGRMADAMDSTGALFKLHQETGESSS